MPIDITDLNFADDIALLTEEIDQAEMILDILQEEAGKMGIHCNVKKRVFQADNQPSIKMTSNCGCELKQVSNFKYLGAWI